MPLVFAYGSNLDPAQMARRCPLAQPVGRGELLGHRFAFAGHSLYRGGAVANVEPAPGGRVPGFVWHVDAVDLARLDRYEGAPRVYVRERRLVVLADGRRVHAHVYFMRTRADAGVPARPYLGTVLSGCAATGVPSGHMLAAFRSAYMAGQRHAKGRRIAPLALQGPRQVSLGG